MTLRIRVLPLPRDQFMLILDGASDDIMDIDTTTLGEHLRENLDGCGGALIFNHAVGAVDLPEVEYPYG